MTQTTAAQPSTTATTSTLFMSFELSAKTWRMAFRDGRTDLVCEHAIDAADFDGLAMAIQKARRRLSLPPDARLVSCYEAGRDGFWIHRALLEKGIQSFVVDPASLEVNRRAKQRKTDRMDAKRLVLALIRYVRGETEAMRPVRVPNADEEDRRRTSRERRRLVSERTGHRARIKSLLALHGANGKKLETADFEKVVGATGHRLPANLVAELKREQERLQVVAAQIRALEQQSQEALAQTHQELGGKRPKKPKTCEEKSLALAWLCAVSARTGWALSTEFFYRSFQNGRQVGSAAGLTGTPYDSGQTLHEQGISKAGNARVRGLMVELAWMWLRYQPDSALARWFERRFGGGRGSKLVGIVALARKLLVALWRYVEHGVVPEGARFKTQLAL